MKIRNWLARHPLEVESGLIFLTCTFVYLANDVTNGGTKDSVPQSLLALNWIFNRQLNFDNFRGNYFFNAATWFFTESFNGHLTSAYPIGVAIITFPIYLIFAFTLWLNQLTHGSLLGLELVSLDLTSATFEPTRMLFEKIAATLVTAMSVLIFYLSVRLKFARSICLLITFVYAFATSNWTISAQALWQHTASNLVVITIIFCLLKANRTIGTSRKIFLLLTGIASGLLFGIRPTNSIFAVTAIIYALSTYRQESIFLGIGLSSASFSMGWNFYYFGTFLIGGYSNQSFLYSFTIKQFFTSFLGLLVSPSRGLIIFSPVILFAIPGVIQIAKQHRKQDEKLLLSMTFASILLFLNYCFISIWWAGWCYGPRFLTDTLPILCFSIGYPLTTHLRQVVQNRRRLFNGGFICFLTLMLVSTSIQLVGALTLNQAGWDALPISTDIKVSLGTDRLWSFSDSQIERSAKSLVNQLVRSRLNNVPLLQGFDGTIEHISLVNDKPFVTSILAAPGQSLLLQVDLKNTGSFQWAGYQSGVNHRKLVVLLTQFYDDKGGLVKQGANSPLLVSGSPQPGESAQAFGLLVAPKNFGTYRLVLTLIGPDQDSTHRTIISHAIKVKIDPQQQVFSQDFKQMKVPKTIPAGKTISIFGTVQSYSNFIWSKTSKNPVNFSYRWLNSQGEVVVFEGERTPLPGNIFYDKNSVYGGGGFSSIAMNAKVKAPDHPGKYILRLTMVQEGVGWFDAKGAKPKDIPVTITDS
jgi:hypothetical protein